MRAKHELGVLKSYINVARLCIQQPNQLKYAFLEPQRAKPIIILVALIEPEEKKLLETLRKYKEALPGL